MRPMVKVTITQTLNMTQKSISVSVYMMYVHFYTVDTALWCDK